VLILNLTLRTTIVNNIFYKKNKRLPAGAIIAIILALVFVLIIAGIMFILLRKKVINYNTQDRGIESSVEFMKHSYI
jgi:hypothetical protein